jgi:hypothetical protein
MGIADCGLRIVDCGLWIADCGLRICCIASLYRIFKLIEFLKSKIPNPKFCGKTNKDSF